MITLRAETSNQINYKSDFEIAFVRTDHRGNPLPAPSCDWSMKIWTDSYEEAAVVYCKGEEYHDCYISGDELRVLVNDHNLRPGRLQVEYIEYDPHDKASDRILTQVIPIEMDITLVDGPSYYSETLVSAIQLAAIKGDKGDRIEFKDFTSEDIKELQRPATEAAEIARKATEDANKAASAAIMASSGVTAKEAEVAAAEAVRESNEQARKEAESARRLAENTRAAEENTRIANENARKKAEVSRTEAESARAGAENARKTAEDMRVVNESTRQTQEGARQGAENLRSEAETTRQSQETTRQSNETERAAAEARRQAAEKNRNTGEVLRENAEAVRSDNEAARRSAESDRNTAEKGRVAAEQTRAADESTRHSHETSRQTNEVSRQTAFNTLKADAEKATSDANTAATNANAATANAKEVADGMEESLAEKLDKSVWEEKTKSFSISGVIAPTTGGITLNPSSAWRATEFLPLNRNHPLVVDLQTNSNGDQYGGIFFYDECKAFISHICTPTNTRTEIASSEIPSEAVYFRCNGVRLYTNIYTNGPTFEAREGAVSEAISKVATVKLNKSEWEPKNRQFNITNFRLGANGVVNPSDAPSRITPLIPINHDYDIKIATRLINGNPGVQFFDEYGVFISDAFGGLDSDTTRTERVLPKDEIPENAVYFRAGAYASTTATEPSWENGGTFEDREASAAEAVLATSDAKLDKKVWNDWKSQFGNVGQYILPDTGHIYTHEKFGISDYIPINRNFPIVVVADTTNNASALVLYDQNLNFLGGVSKNKNLIDAEVEGFVHTLPVDKIPENAVFFRAGTNLTLPTRAYSNGPTFESREGAISNVIAAANKALFIDMWNQACTQGGNSYGRYNAKTGFFELNGLTDISYEEALLIYKRSPNAYAPYICQDLRVRTVLP